MCEMLPLFFILAPEYSVRKRLNIPLINQPRNQTSHGSSSDNSPSGSEYILASFMSSMTSIPTPTAFLSDENFILTNRGHNSSFFIYQVNCTWIMIPMLALRPVENKCIWKNKEVIYLDSRVSYWWNKFKYDLWVEVSPTPILKYESNVDNPTCVCRQEVILFNTYVSNKTVKLKWIDW